MPLAKFPAVIPAAELLQLPPTGTLATSLITSAVGTPGVSVLLARSCFAEKATSPFGVTGQEQHETNCSSGVKAYRLAQRAPVMLAVVPACRPAPSAPVLVMSVNESPAARFAA